MDAITRPDTGQAPFPAIARGKRFLTAAWLGFVLGGAALGPSISALAAETTCQSPNHVAPGYAGIHLNYAAASMRWPGSSDTTFPIHVKAIRLWDSGVTWLDLEPEKGSWNFRQLDHYVSTAEKSGADILLTLGMTPRWASARPDEPSSFGKGHYGAAAPPANLDDWENYVRTIAKRYRGRIRYYEIWNEPKFADMESVYAGSKISHFTSGKVAGFFSGTADDMVALTSLTTNVLRVEDPTARVVSPSMSGHHQGFKRLEQFLEKGGGKSIDILGFHFYQSDSWLPEDSPRMIQRAKEIAKKYGFAGPIWNTEMGLVIESPVRAVRPLSDAPKALLGRVFPVGEATDAMARFLILGAACGLDRYYWLAWDNGSMGLTYSADGKVRHVSTAGRAFINMADWLNDSTVGPCSQTSGVWRCLFSSPSLGTGQWIWLAGDHQGSAIDLGKPRKTTRLDGTSSIDKAIIPGPQPVFVAN